MKTVISLSAAVGLLMAAPQAADAAQNPVVPTAQNEITLHSSAVLARDNPYTDSIADKKGQDALGKLDESAQKLKRTLERLGSEGAGPQTADGKNIFPNAPNDLSEQFKSVGDPNQTSNATPKLRMDMKGAQWRLDRSIQELNKSLRRMPGT